MISRRCIETALFWSLLITDLIVRQYLSFSAAVPYIAYSQITRFYTGTTTAVTHTHTHAHTHTHNDDNALRTWYFHTCRQSPYK